MSPRRLLGSCKTVANVLVICTAKTFTPTMNDMSVIADSFGIHTKFIRKLEDFLINQAVLNSTIPHQLQGLPNAAIAVEPGSSNFVFVGSKTETALLKFVKELRWTDYKKRGMLQKSYRCFRFRANVRLWMSW